MKILFLSDIHGSSLIFEKALNAVSNFGIDILIISGDLAGKDIRPIIGANGFYKTEMDGKVISVSEREIHSIKKRLEDLGHYYFLTNQEEFKKLQSIPDRIMKILDEKILERLEEWILKIIDQINVNKTKVIISPGNDDTKQIDSLLIKYNNRGIYTGLKNPILFKEVEIITLDYTNITPWNTERELNEKKLKKLIAEKIGGIKNVENAIFNFHCPPFNTKLDLAPQLDKDLKYDVKPGGINIVHTGSTAVFESIKEYQPLLSLHGHIHESKGFEYIGRTLSLNPGSEHEKGILNAYIIDIDEKCTIRDFYLIEE
ncbi:metallophosphoesterase [Saccharicrinis sp. FJH2]|uniref:metallophosphoesterase family protein n=1 Tax=Saccharicrinis sp. FJH65 TaxID=3344659 RepID=UPI0035F43E05